MTPTLRAAALAAIGLALAGGVAAGAPWASPALALVAGVALGLAVGDPAPALTRRLAPLALQAAVIGLGAGTQLGVVAAVGLHGLGYTAAGLALAFALGAALRRLLRVERDVALLVTVGTAICGGSAIAAVAPVIDARAEDVSLALAIVFLLNALALLLFPALGHALALDEARFGLWAALAIHDTSSVVGAAARYGAHAVEVATAAKLARALWIVPVGLAVAWSRRRGAGPAARPRPPWFIAGFVAAAAVVTWVPALAPAGRQLAVAARGLLAASLYVVGLRLSPAALRRLGPRPVLLGVALWVALAAATAGALVAGLITA